MQMKDHHTKGSRGRIDDKKAKIIAVASEKSRTGADISFLTNIASPISFLNAHSVAERYCYELLLEF